MESEHRDHPASAHDVVFLEHLERRRGAFDQSMWQAPALTIAAQAFLLNVLTDESVDMAARAVILVGGVTASAAAAASLIRLRWREVQYSEEIGRWFADRNLPDPRLPHPSTANPAERFSERWLREWAGRWRLRVYLLWCLALVIFAVADVVAFASSN
jgi:hypothetical protein